MPVPKVDIERTLRALFAVLCLAMALAPLARSGFDGDDHELLVRASGHLGAAAAGTGSVEIGERPDRPVPLTRLAPLEVMDLLGDDEGGDVGSLLSGYSIALSQRMFGSADEGPLGLPSAAWYRFENLLWLVVAALGLWRFLWRIYRPWVGSDQATRASSAAAFLFVLHPLSVPSIAALDGRADLMALAFGTWAAAAFLRGRQERRYGFVYTAGVLCLLAGLCGQVALMLPLVMALAEVFSSYRYRPLAARLRTAVVTLLVFSAVVQINTALVSTLTGHGYYPTVLVTLSRLGGLDGALRAFALSVEKVGVLLLPANLSTLGLVGLFGAGLLGLVALQPALIAARTAPRLWGWTLVCWAAAVMVSLTFGVHERARLDGLVTARTLLPATVAMCAGWGLAATALPGLRRIGVPVALALGFAVLAHGNAVAWERGARAYGEFVQVVRDRAPDRGVQLVVDAPRAVAGMDPIGTGMPFVRHPLFETEAPWPASALSLDVDAAFLGTLVRAGDFRAWREQGLRVGLPDGEGGYEFADVRPTSDATATIEWSEPAGVARVAVDPARATSFELVVRGEGARAGARLHFEGTLRSGSIALLDWRDRDGHAVADLDLAARPEWVLAGRVEALRVEGVESGEYTATLRADLPELAVVGDVALDPGGAWSFGALREPGARGTVRLAVLDRTTLDGFEVEFKVPADGRLRIDRPVVQLDALRRGGPEDLVFELTHTARDGTRGRRTGSLPRDFAPRRR